ncbi:MAG: DUF6379 domain-containing protein [Lachnospiraceae bacterium]|jgi:hypothetical protein|nr:DUF6379 domain-containing protein [Lachnospiraceae bacterium]
MPEFGNSVLCEQGFRNVSEEGRTTGFQLRVRISYYRGIALSILDGYDIVVDGRKFAPEDVSFSLDGKTFIDTADFGKHPEIRWEYGDKAYLHVKCPGGLERGIHDVKVTQRIAVPYLPFSTAFYQEKRLTIVQ